MTTAQPGIVAFVVADGPATPLELRQARPRRLPDSMLPDRIELVDALPLTPSSKLDERRLLAEAGLAGFRRHRRHRPNSVIGTRR